MPAPAHTSVALSSFIAFFETLTPQSLQVLGQFYSERTRFQDPFNQTTGVTALQTIFEDMFEQLHEPAFRVVQVIEQIASEPDQRHQAFLVWDFTFRFKSFRSAVTQNVRGSSHIVFDSTGRVVDHHDYWDAAGQLYEKMPLLGGLMRWLRNRLSVG